MRFDSTTKQSLKRKLKHETAEFAWTFLYVLFVLLAIATYRMLLLQQFEIGYVAWGMALINALLFAKIILIGSYAKLGIRFENQPLIVTVFVKAFLFSLLIIVANFLEKFFELLIHEHDAGRAFFEVRTAGVPEVICRGIVIFSALIPFFALHELGRVLGEGRLFRLFVGRRAPASSL